MAERSAFPVCDVLDVGCFVGDIATAADVVIERALSGGGYAVLCNVHVLMTAQRESEVRAALEGAWAVFPDGAPVAWLQRRAGIRLARRIGGPDLMSAVLDHGRAHGLRHALFGSTPHVVQRLASRLQARFPGVDIVAVHSPARGEEENRPLLARIAAAQPHVVWCALGAPRQELWMASWASALAPALVLGVGAAFDFHAGTKQRAPDWMQRVGLEWLHRLGTEPRRLVLRYATTNAAFVVLAATRITRRRLA